MNSIHTNSIANNANINRNNTNTGLNANTNINNRIVKENTSMNTNTCARSANIVARLARRSAASLLAFGGLLALSHSAVKADIVVDKFVGPQQVYSYDYGQLVASAGTTALQVKIRNTDNTNVSGITVQTYVYLASDANNGWTVRAMPALTSQSLGPYQSKWVTLAIPQMARQGFSLYNRMLWAKSVVTGKEYWVKNVLDRPADNVQASIPQYNSSNSTFSITFTNNGSQNAPAKNVTLTATPSDSNGSVVPQSSVTPQKLSLPALGVGRSATLTFTMPTWTNGAEFCALDIQIADPLIGYSSDNSAQVYY